MSSSIKPMKTSLDYSPQHTMNIQQDAFEIKYSIDRTNTLNFVDNQEVTITGDENNVSPNRQKQSQLSQIKGRDCS